MKYYNKEVDENSFVEYYQKQANDSVKNIFDQMGSGYVKLVSPLKDTLLRAQSLASKAAKYDDEQCGQGKTIPIKGRTYVKTVREKNNIVKCTCIGNCRCVKISKPKKRKKPVKKKCACTDNCRRLNKKTTVKKKKTGVKPKKKELRRRKQLLKRRRQVLKQKGRKIFLVNIKCIKHGCE
jgi:hypothetical protein